MTTKSVFRLPNKARGSYLELVQEFPLASIRSAAHLRAAQRVMDKLLAIHKLDAGQSLYLDALSDLTAAYEAERRPIPPASDADLLAHLIEAKGVSQAELCRVTGIAKSTVSEILAGKRPFSRGTIRKLAEYFKLDAGILSANL